MNLFYFRRAIVFFLGDALNQLMGLAFEFAMNIEVATDLMVFFGLNARLGFRFLGQTLRICFKRMAFVPNAMRF